MTGSTASGNSQPIQVNTLTSQVTQHGNMTLVNSPKGVTMAWEAPATMDVAETSRYLGVNNLRLETTTDMATGETTSVAYTEFTHEEYEAYRNSRQGRVLELPPQPPEKQGNTLGRITFTPAPASTRAEYANPPEPVPAEKEGDTPNPQLQALIDKANDDRSLWQRTKDGASSAWDSTKRVASASWENPGEFGKGVAKGIGNLPSDLANLVVEGAKSGFGSPVSVNNYAKLLDYQAMNAYEAGNITQANAMANQANSIREFGQVGDIFEIKNDAQQGGSIASIFVPLGTLVKAPAAAAKGMRAAKAADAVADTSKVANAAGDANKAAHVDDVSKAPTPKGPNGNGGKIEKKRTNHEAGAFGEKMAHSKMEELGYERIDNGGEYKPGANGIDGVYKNPSPPPDYVIMEAKYNTAKLGKTADGKQMGDKWVSRRLEDSVGKIEADNIKEAMDNGTVEKWLLRVDEQGNVTGKTLDSAGNIIRGEKPF